jgi:mannose-6-phosphate isomerase
MERLMKSITPKVGDVFIVPAKTVHAIGAGCLILEIQEPTDFTIQPERWCGEYKLSDSEMYLGLSKESATECFEFGETPRAEVTPKIVLSDPRLKIESLIDESLTPCFKVNRITLSEGGFAPDVKDSYGVYIVTEGEGEIAGDGYKRTLRRGDYFFMPYAAMGKYNISGSLTLVECY